LKMAIPSAVKKLKPPDPIFCMRIYFYDTHAPQEGYGLRLRVLTEPLRRRLTENRPRSARLTEELWHPQTGVANRTPGREGLYEIDLAQSRDLAKVFAEVYELLCQSEDDHMPRLRELARKLSQVVNAQTWGPPITVTDDFVVFPADGSGFFGGEFLDDLHTSVPTERVELLRQRGYLD